MTYAVSSALQTSVFQALQADSALSILVGGNIFDTAPTGTAPPLYVAIGAEDVRDASDKTGGGATHDFTVAIVTTDSGFLVAKDAAAAVCDVLVDADLILARGRLVSLRFLQARAKRVQSGGSRRIDLRFRARVEDN